MFSNLMERNINNVTDYNQKREVVSTSDDRLHILEVDGICPICGKTIIERTGKKTKLYDIAHIYPNNPTPNEKIILANANVLGKNSEAFQNKIALCKLCHKKYDYHKNITEYNNLLEKKKKLFNAYLSKDVLSEQELEDEIKTLLDKIATIDFSDTEIKKLRMKSIPISHKFTESEMPLMLKVHNYVINYFSIIRELFKNLTEEKKLNFDFVASTVKTSYLSISDFTNDKDYLFNHLVEWIMSKTNINKRPVCEIFISYFIQDCEVFDEITK